MVALDPNDIANSLYRLARQYPGETLRVTLSEEPSVIIQNPQDLNHILRVNPEGYRKYMNWFRQIIGPSRFSEDGEEWQRRYQLSHRHFTEFQRDPLFSLATAAAESLGAQMSRSGQNRVSITPLRAAMADVLCRYFLRVPLAQIGINLDAMSDLVEIATHFAIRPPQLDDREAQRRLFQLRRETLAQLSSIRNLAAPQGSFLADVMAADARETDPIYLEHEMLIFFAAGSDASAASIGWALLALADNPALAERLAESLRTVDWAAPNAAAQVLANQTLSGFLSEILRLFPPFPVIGRQATRADTLSVGPIEPGQKILISLIGTMVREDPSAAIRQAEFGQPPAGVPLAGSSGAFSMGPRICGGKKFALLELAAVTARLISLYRIERTEEVTLDFKWKAQLVHQGGYPVRLIAR